jgi:hypothetical protein
MTVFAPDDAPPPPRIGNQPIRHADSAKQRCRDPR